MDLEIKLYKGEKMFRKSVLGILVAASSLFAHSAIMNCFDNGDGTITCEGGFSDGSSASGVEFRVEQDGKVLLKDKMSKNSEFTFKKPSGTYTAIFNAGEGHQVIINGKDIVQ